MRLGARSKALLLACNFAAVLIVAIAVLQFHDVSRTLAQRDPGAAVDDVVAALEVTRTATAVAIGIAGLAFYVEVAITLCG